jgi:hypothetical protein
MDRLRFGNLLLLAAAVLAAAGLLVRAGALSWFGRLPGDIRVEGEASRVYVPLTSCLVLSAVLSALVWLVRRLL